MCDESISVEPVSSFVDVRSLQIVGGERGYVGARGQPFACPSESWALSRRRRLRLCPGLLALEAAGESFQALRARCPWVAALSSASVAREVILAGIYMVSRPALIWEDLTGALYFWLCIAYLLRFTCSSAEMGLLCHGNGLLR